MSEKHSSKYGTVYGLRSSEDGKLRYIGQTTQKLKRRLYAHNNRAKRRFAHDKYYETPVACWIRSVHEKGFCVEIFVIEDEATISDAEIKWISYYRTHGAKLVNVTDGGKGGLLGILNPCSEEAKRKLSLAKKGRKLTEEHKTAISRSLTGRVQSKEQLRKFSEARKGHSVSTATRAKISASLKGRPAPWVRKRNEERRRLPAPLLVP